MARVTSTAEEPLLTVKATANLSGVSAFTLRAWERRYGAVKPRRSQTGRRGYSLAEVERLRLLRRLIQSGHSIGSIAKLTQDELLRMVHAATVQAQPGHDKVSQIAVQEVLDALESYQLKVIHECLARIRMTLSARAFVLSVLSPLLQRVGERVARGELTLGQEHALSALIRVQLARIHEPYQSERSTKEAFVFTTPEGELHEFGIQLAGILAFIHGVKAHYLGPNLPVGALVEAIQALDATHVILGTTETLPSEAVKKYFDQLHAELPQGVAVWVGGQGATHLAPHRFRGRELLALQSLDELDQRLALL